MRAGQDLELYTLLVYRIEMNQPVIQPRMSEADISRARQEDLFVSMIEAIMLEFIPKSAASDPRRLVQVLIALSPEPSFKDPECPAFYIRDDEPVESLRQRVQLSIKAWADAHRISDVQLGVQFGLSRCILNWHFIN